MLYRIGMDLSLRKTGITCISEDGISFKMIYTSNKIKQEDLLIHNVNEVMSYLNQYKDGTLLINIEGLSHNSISRSIDIISAYHWMVRCAIKSTLTATVCIVEPLSWQSKLITKDVRANIDNLFPLTRLSKASSDYVSAKKTNDKNKAMRKKFLKNHYLKCVEDKIMNKIENYVTDNKLPYLCTFDLCDSYHIAKFNI